MDKMQKDIAKMHDEDSEAITAEIRSLKQETHAISRQLAEVLQILRSKA
jgi:hypothetical protein